MGARFLGESQQEALLAAAQACATFSLLGSSFILACYCCFSHLRKLSLTLVAWLAIADVGADITYFMGNPVDKGATCIAQASLQQFFQMAQILWTVAIACVLYDITVNLRMYHPHEQASLMKRFHICVWGAAFVSMLLPFTSDSYGSTGSWCWIETTQNSELDIGTVWRYLVLYLPLWFAIAFNIVVYVRIVRVVRRFSVGMDGGAEGGETIGPSAEQQDRIRNFVKRLVWYPAVLILAWTFATVNRIQNAVDPQNPIFALYLLHTSLVGLQGFFNSVVYGSTDAVRTAVSETSFVQRFVTGCRESRSIGAGMELDPEDETSSYPGIAMGNSRQNNDTVEISLARGDGVELSAVKMESGVTVSTLRI